MLTSLPNLLTLGRIAAIPVIIALLFVDTATARWAALLVYVAACVTDYFDGLLARRQGLVSPLGRFLDPIADKLLVTAIVVMLIANGDVAGITVLAAIIILCREILVSGLREFLAELSVPMPVSKLAKWKTTVQMVALGVLVVGEAGPAALALPLIGTLLLWLAAALTMVTGYDYLSRGLKHMLAD
jgi:cardiolipin synthase